MKRTFGLFVAAALFFVSPIMVVANLISSCESDQIELAVAVVRAKRLCTREAVADEDML